VFYVPANTVYVGYMGDGFNRSKDPTNSIKVLKEQPVPMSKAILSTTLMHCRMTSNQLTEMSEYKINKKAVL